jgi:hypothetical protein
VTGGQYRASLRETKQLLKRKGLLKGDNDCNGRLSRAFLDSLFADYLTVYRVAVENFDYDCLLCDDSFFQFAFRSDSDERVALRYAFYEQPLQRQTYQEFLEGLGFDPTEAGDELRDEYEQSVAESDINWGAVALRYDYSEDGYKEGVHPASHMHIGLRNDIRLPLEHFLTPKMFVLFTLRQVYPAQWEGLLRREEFRRLAARTKKGCPRLGSGFSRELDKAQLVLK